MKITLNPDMDYEILPPTTTFAEVKPGDRFISYGRTFVILKAEINKTGKMVAVESTCISDHPDDLRNYRPIGMRLHWNNRISTPVHRRVYRPATWSQSEEPYFAEFVIHEEGYAETFDPWADYQERSRQIYNERFTLSS